MKVLFDADVIDYPLTGIGRYAYELSRHLLMSHEVDTMYFAKHLSLSRDLPIIQASPETKSGNALKKILRRSALIRAGYHELKQQWLLKSCMRIKPDVYHAPSFIAKKLPFPTVVTIHDFSFMRFPQYHLPERVDYLKKYLPETIKRADHLITDSEFVKQELIDFYPEAKSKVSAIHLGVDERFMPKSQTETMQTLQKYGLRYQGYVLSVATIEPRKNIAGLIKAYAMLSDTLQREYPLILVGHAGWLSTEVHVLLQNLQKKRVLHYLGYLSDEELVDIYASAKCFVYPSFYEGFGLPVIESMACGVPVVVSNNSSLTEVAGSSALLVNPAKTEEIADVLCSLCEANVEMLSIQNDNVKKASQFTWRKCAENVLNVYKCIV